MNTVTIINKEEINGRIYIDLKSGKKAAFFNFNKEQDDINVICKNAAHKVYKGSGKMFQNWDEVRSHYRSFEMIDMIEHVMDIAKSEKHKESAEAW